MPRFPTGLLVMGDAHCSLNPIYGQGMTMAALQALALRDCLRSGDADLARRFFARAAQPIGQAWSRNRSNERMSVTTGRRPLRKRLRSQIIKGTLIAASNDTAVAESLLRVGHLIDPPTQLNNPRLLLRIATASARNLFVRLRDRSPMPDGLSSAQAPDRFPRRPVTIRQEIAYYQAVEILSVRVQHTLAQKLGAGVSFSLQGKPEAASDHSATGPHGADWYL